MGRSGFLTFALRAPKTTLLLIAMVTALLGGVATNLRFDPSPGALIADDDPARAYAGEIAATFGSEEVTLIGVFADDVFQPAVLDRIDALSRAIADLDGVQQVVSLTTVQNAYSDDDGLHVGRLIRAIPRAPEEIEVVRQKTLANPLYLKLVVAPDGKASSITVVYRNNEEGSRARADQAKIRELVGAQNGPGVSFAITSLPNVGAGGAPSTAIVEIAGAALLAVALLLAIGFRSAGGVAIPLVASVVAALWSAGIAAAAGAPLNAVTYSAPVLGFALALVFAVHLVAAVAPAAPSESSVTEAMRTRGAPAAAASLVAIACLLPYLFSQSPSLRRFGALAFAAVVAASLIAISLVPATLALWPTAGAARGAAWLARLGRGARANRRLILFAAALAALLALLGLLRGPRATTDLDGDAARISEKLAGTQPITLVIEGEGPNSVTKLRALQAMKGLQSFVAEQPGVDTVASLVDYLGVLRHALDAGELGSMPATQEEVDQLFLFANPDDLKPLVNGDRSRAVILVRTRLGDSAAVAAFVDAVGRYADEHLPRGVSARATGAVVYVNAAAEALAMAQRRALWQAAIALVVGLSIVFLSLRSGIAVSLVVGLAPLFALGLRGWLGIEKSPWSATLPPFVLAIAIAQVAAFLAVFHRAAHATRNPELGASAAMLTGGRPLLMSGAAVAAALWVAGALTGAPLREAALAGGATIAAYTLLSVFLDPALAASRSVICVWDLFHVDLGRDPQREIPLFAGLRAHQAKIVVLLARRERAARGSLLTRRGDTREEIFVLLDGQADVYHGAGTPPLRKLGRGDVVGEMGFDAQRRSVADVVVSEAADVVVLDAAILKRLERRYPRIAAVVMLNLTRILSDRLESTTEALAGSRPRSS